PASFQMILDSRYDETPDAVKQREPHQQGHQRVQPTGVLRRFGQWRRLDEHDALQLASRIDARGFESGEGAPVRIRDELELREQLLVLTGQDVQAHPLRVRDAVAPLCLQLLPYAGNLCLQCPDL